MISQGVNSQIIIMIMEVLIDEEPQEMFGDFLVSVRGEEVPEWKLIVIANMMADKLSFQSPTVK